MIELLLTLSVLIAFSFLAFWKPNPILFIVVAGISIMAGFTWYDKYVTNLGLTVGLMLVAYSLYCIGMAFRLLFWNRESGEE